MVENPYEGTDPCHEVLLEWRHEKVEYIFRLIKDLTNKEFVELMKKLETLE